MKARTCLIGWCLLSGFELQASDDRRFAVRESGANWVTSTEDDRFSVQAHAEIHRLPPNPPRFTLKSTTAACGPLPEALFSNGFE